MVNNNLKINQVYTNEEITQLFQCAPQGGMRRSLQNNVLVLISQQNGKTIYEDKWIGNVLHYTGMGQISDQDINYSQNKTLAESNISNITLHLFEQFKEKEYVYAGIVTLIGEPYEQIEPDKEGNERKVVKFPIKLSNSEYAPQSSQIKLGEQILQKNIKKRSIKEIEQIALKQSSLNKNKNSFRPVKTQIYTRDPAIREYVKKLANGICQLCELPAPFEVRGEPFLHVHHIEYLSKGGEDTIENSIAVCPNCHARIHQLELKSDKDKLLKKVAERSK